MCCASMTWSQIFVLGERDLGVKYEKGLGQGPGHTRYKRKEVKEGSTDETCKGAAGKGGEKPGTWASVE